MLSVSHDPVVVDSQLLSGKLVCPHCRGVLKRWGYGLRRIIRYETPVVNRWFTPRRARCRECGVTHILLPVDLAARRADAACVIAEAVELHVVEEFGHRKIAEKLGRPFSTVRGWLRDFTANAPAIATTFAARVHRATAQALEFLPAPAATVAADALGMLMAHAKVLTRIHRPESQAEPIVSLTWHRAGVLAVGPWLFSPVGWP